eukprot:2854919-Amphidinium_carterae.2
MDNLYRHAGIEFNRSLRCWYEGEHSKRRFVDTWKGDLVRSRMAAQEFNTGYQSHVTVTQCTPGIKVVRTIVSFAATKFTLWSESTEVSVHVGHQCSLHACCMTSCPLASPEKTSEG